MWYGGRITVGKNLVLLSSINQGTILFINCLHMLVPLMHAYVKTVYQ